MWFSTLIWLGSVRLVQSNHRCPCLQDAPTCGIFVASNCRPKVVLSLRVCKDSWHEDFFFPYVCALVKYVGKRTRGVELILHTHAYTYIIYIYMYCEDGG